MRYALPDVLLQPLVQSALREDLGRRGDITSEATIDSSKILNYILLPVNLELFAVFNWLALPLHL